MDKAASGPILRVIRQVVEDQGVRAASDRELLQRFSEQRDAAAFHAILHRHGAIVLDVCRGVLGNEANAEDAFQATFLILARKAGSIRKAASIASWLHSVAYRTALQARSREATRKQAENHAPARQTDVADDLSWREVRTVLHEELANLPERYRAALVMCYLESNTQSQAAARLGLAKSTLKERLERGRELLRARLVRRGLGPAALLVAADWLAPVASACLPPTLVLATLRAAGLSGAGQATAGVTPAKVAALSEGVIRAMFVTKLKIALALLVVIALIGGGVIAVAMQAPHATLTERFPSLPDGRGSDRQTSAKEEPQEKTHTVSGRCFDHADSTVLAGITVRLYRAEGRTSPPEEIAKTVTDAEGRYAFTGLEPPRPEDHFDRLTYAVLGFAGDRPIGISFHSFRNDKEVVELRMTRERSTLSGKVVDAAGRPVARATVMQYWIDGRPIPGVLSATTDAQGRFKIDKVGVYKRRGETAPLSTSFTVGHPDHPETSGEASTLPADVVVTLPAGCVVTGTVTDSVTGRPAAGAMITARRVDQWKESVFATDAAGRFRLPVPEGRYDFLVEAKDRVCVAVTGRDCLAGEKVELPPFKLVVGGFISGQVVNTATGEAVSIAESGGPIMLGLYGPSQPAGPVISPKRMAAVDKTGRFTLRAAPGDNFPYFVNIRGVRMAWDTRQQPPVIVKDGETTAYNMLITPEVPPEVRLRAARKLVEGLSKKPADRTAQILAELRKLSHTVDETEAWCLLMRELVALGREAVPQVCAELDRATEDRMLRRLGFALRAIGDARAVPALIRALPRTLLPSSSDYGLIVNDADLTEFMQTHDLDQGRRGTYFNLGRPGREIVGALHKLTKQDFDDAELFSMHLSDDPRRQVLQRRIYKRQAQRWQTWWEANWRSFTDDAAYSKVNLNVADEPLPPAPQALGKTARLKGEWSGLVLSPAAEEGRHAWHFYDLDTGYRPNWPARIPRDEASRDAKQLADWASQNGVDLMCVTHRAPDGTETYVLQALGMKVREINPREVRTLDKLIAAGTLPEGRPVGELLMHYDDKSRQLVPDANAAFLFVTRDGNMGLIEITDRVTRTANLTGFAGSPPPGVGFHKGVRFNLKAIVP